MSTLGKYSGIWLVIGAAATLVPHHVSLAKVTSPAYQVVVLRAELLVIERNLGCARSDLLQVLSDIACDVDPPYVAKMIAENQQLEQYRAFASMAEQAVEDASLKLDPSSQRMQLLAKQAVRLQLRADEYEVQLRIRQREIVVAAYTESVSGLESSRDKARRELATWVRRAEEEAASRLPTTAP